MRCPSDHLAALRREFPGYLFSVTPTWYGTSIVAQRVKAGNTPLIVITADVSELRKLLSER